MDADTIYSHRSPKSATNKLRLNGFFRAETLESGLAGETFGCQVKFYCIVMADDMPRAELIGNYDIRLILLMSIGVTMLLDVLPYILVDGKSIFAEYVPNYVLNRSYVLNFGSCTDDRRGGRKSYPPSAAALRGTIPDQIMQNVTFSNYRFFYKTNSHNFLDSRTSAERHASRAKEI